MKKFFKKTEGFTLVELIVVIAILGILAGVGTVGYSGYIKKANMAADQQLIGFVNQAFAAACIENGVDQKQVANATETMTDRAVTGVTVTADAIVSAEKATEIAADFQKYFAGNQGSKFKLVTGLQYSAVKGFYSVELDGISAEMQAAADNIKQMLTGTSYSGREETVVNNIQTLTNTMENMLGVMEPDVLGNLLGGSFGAYLTENGVDEEDPQAVANYATLFLADQVAGLSDSQKAEIARLWSTNNFNYGGNIMNGVQQYMGANTGLSAMGAMAVFYANAEACVQNLATNYNPTDLAKQAEKQAVIDAFNGVAVAMSSSNSVDGAWQALATGYQNMIVAANGNMELIGTLGTYGSMMGTTDANGFIGAMGSINENADELKDMTNSDNMYGNLASAFK